MAFGDRIEPLDGDGQRLIEEAVPHIRASLRDGWHRAYVRCLGYDDAVQVACVAAIRAAGDFREELAARQDRERVRLFMSYAGFWIRYFLGRAAGREGVMRDARYRVVRRPGPRRMASLSASVASPLTGETATLASLVPDRRDADPADIAARRDEIASYLSVLDPKQRRAMELIGGGYTSREAGAIMGLHRTRVRQLFLQARKRIGMAATLRNREGGPS